MNSRNLFRVGILAAVLALFPAFTSHLPAQDLEPRAFSPAPVGVNFAAVGYGYSFGNVLLDPSLLIEDGTGKVHSLAAAYVRTFSFFGMTAKADAVVPFASGDWKGLLDGEPATRSATGFGDPTVRLAVNFVGAPALEIPRFLTFRQRWIVGASLEVLVPIGQYDPERLINLGSNRWTFIPRVGVSRSLGRWTLEGVAAAWLFMANTDFLGTTLEQDPLWTVQGSVSYVFDGGAWLAADGGWGSGGRTKVNGASGSERQENVRYGVTFAYPLTRRTALKLAWIGGLSTRLGADFDTIALVYQYRWGGGL